MMKKSPFQRIEFHPQKNLPFEFEIMRFEKLMERLIFDHDPEKTHRVDFYIIQLITGGAGKHIVDFQEYELQRGSVLTIRKDQVHRYIRSDVEGYLLLFTNEFVAHHFERLAAIQTLQIFNELMGSPHIQLPQHEFTTAIELTHKIETEFQSTLDEYSAGIIRSFLHILVSQLYRFKSKDGQLGNKKYLPSFIKFQQLVEQQCFTTKKVKDYAEQMGISPKTLNHIVQHITAKPAKQFIDELVITQIKRLLVNTNLSVKEIAYQAGFNEPSNLFKYFKRYSATSPEIFRRKNQ